MSKINLIPIIAAAAAGFLLGKKTAITGIPKLSFYEKVSIIYSKMKIVQDKVINRENLTPFEEKLFYYFTSYGFHNGSKQAVKDKLI